MVPGLVTNNPQVHLIKFIKSYVNALLFLLICRWLTRMFIAMNINRGEGEDMSSAENATENARTRTNYTVIFGRGTTLGSRMTAGGAHTHPTKQAI